MAVRFPNPGWRIALAVVAVAAGFLVTYQLRLEFTIRRTLNVPSRRLEELAYSLQRQEHERAALESEIGALRARVADLETKAASGRSLAGGLRRELDGLRVAAGLERMRGPGIVVTLSDSRRPLRPGDDPNLVILHYSDIHKVIAELWAAGAEAIAVNDERLVPTSGLNCVGTTILCNATRLAPPYRITALGDAAALARALRAPGATLQLLRAFEFPVTVAAGANLEVPAYRGGFRLAYGRPAP